LSRDATIPDATLRLKAIQMLVLSTGLWGLSFPIMKALALTQEKILPNAGSWFVTSLDVMYRFGAAGLLMALLKRRDLKTISRREIEQGLKLAAFGAGGILFQMDGLSYTAASTSAFLTQGYCVFIPLWIALTNRRLPSQKIFLSSALVLTGVAVLANLDLQTLKPGRGELETLIASLLFTGQILCLEHPRYAANRPECFSTVMFLAMALLCLPFVGATMPDASACVLAYASPAACGFLAILVLFCTLGAYNMMNRWQRHVTATEAGLIYCVEPVFASVLALFLPGWFSRWSGIGYADEQLTLRLFIGGGLIIAANVLLQSKWPAPGTPDRLKA
jgi:drug/metabolite transporter (DMT)-like permease